MPESTEKEYDFDAIIDRAAYGALKFDSDLMESVFGVRDLWPSWVADMDFKASPEIRKALAQRVEHDVYGYESDNQALPEAKNRLLVLCNPHNPIGRVWSKDDLLRLSEICARNGVRIIADEIHGDITYQQTYVPLASVSQEAAINTFSCISPVKSFNLAGVASSMIVIRDEGRRRRCKDWFSRFEVNKNNIFTTVAMLAAYTRGEPWLKAVTDYLQGNIKALRDYLQQNMPAVRLIEPEGTYLVWLDFRALGLDAKALAHFLSHHAGIASNPGHWFGREGAGFARINIASPRPVLMEALASLERAIKWEAGN